METMDPRAVLMTLVAERGESLAALSRLIGRNAAYLQQFVQRGSPRALNERDRRRLAAYLGIDEARLGAPEATANADASIRIARYDAAASAGAGALVDSGWQRGGEAIDAAVLNRLRVRPSDASIITATGDSMLPTIADGDEMLVNTADRTPGARGGIYVLRIDGTLAVKRVARQADGWRITSDNPAYPPMRPEAVEIIGRVVRLMRTL